MNAKKPFEISRETFKQLTARKLAPTPINYQAMYRAKRAGKNRVLGA